MKSYKENKKKYLINKPEDLKIIKNFSNLIYI